MSKIQETSAASSSSVTSTVGTVAAPTTQGFGTPTGISYVYVQIGKLLFMTVTMTSGTAAGSEAQVALPAGMTTSGSLSASGHICGFVVKAGADAAQNVILVFPNLTYVNFGTQSASASGTAKINGNGLIPNTTLFTFHATVPLA